MTIDEHPEEYVKIHENRRRSMKVRGNHKSPWESMKINDPPAHPSRSQAGAWKKRHSKAEQKHTRIRKAHNRLQNKQKGRQTTSSRNHRQRLRQQRYMAMDQGPDKQVQPNTIPYKDEEDKHTAGTQRTQKAAEDLSQEHLQKPITEGINTKQQRQRRYTTNRFTQHRSPEACNTESPIIKNI